MSLRQRVSSLLRTFDFKNMSAWKKISFQDLEPGRYVVKVYRENPRFAKDRRFIGFAFVDVPTTTTIHLWCHPQGSCKITLVDQQGIGIPDATVQLLSDGVLLTQNLTDGDGIALLVAPSGLQRQYMLRVLYLGFEVMNETLKFGFVRTVVPAKLVVELPLYEWTVQFSDLWGLPPGVELQPRLTNDRMDMPKTLNGRQSGNATFSFVDLVAALYTMEVSYKSFLIKQEITIPSEVMTVVFPVEFPVSFRVLNSHGIPMNEAAVRLSRGGREQDIYYNGSTSTVSIPPGIYHLSVLSGDTIIGQRSLDVVSERSIDLITKQEPIFPFVVLLFGIGLILFGFGWGMRKKDLTYGFIFLVIGIGVTSLVSPWWSLQGSSSDIQTSSSLYLLPLDLVSLTSTTEVTAGELAYFPDIFVTIMTAIVCIILIGCCFLAGVILGKRYMKKRWIIVTLVSILGLSIVALGLFSVVMSAFTEIGVGSLFGHGLVDVSIQGQEQTVPVMCSWSPGLGFWLYTVSTIILLCALILIVHKKKETKKELF